MAETETRSLETLSDALVTGLRSIKKKWHEIDTTLNTHLRDAPLPKEFTRINRLAELVGDVSRSSGNDMLDIEKLITSFETAIGHIYRSREAPWGPWRSIGSQKTVTFSQTLTPHAQAAHITLTRMEQTVEHLLAILNAAQEADTKSLCDSQCNPLPSESPANRQTVSRAFATLGGLLNRSEIAVGRYLSHARAAIPRERRRWKTRIAILVGLCLLTVTLGIASFLMPPMLPTLVGLGLVLKISAIVVGMLGTTNSIFSIVGYQRNRGWNDLTNCIERVRNLYTTVSGSLCANQHVACARDVVTIGHKLQHVDKAVEQLGGVQQRITGKLVLT